MCSVYLRVWTKMCENNGLPTPKRRIHSVCHCGGRYRGCVYIKWQRVVALSCPFARFSENGRGRRTYAKGHTMLKTWLMTFNRKAPMTNGGSEITECPPAILHHSQSRAVSPYSRALGSYTYHLPTTHLPLSVYNLTTTTRTRRIRAQFYKRHFRKWTREQKIKTAPSFGPLPCVNWGKWARHRHPTNRAAITLVYSVQSDFKTTFKCCTNVT